MQANLGALLRGSLVGHRDNLEDPRDNLEAHPKDNSGLIKDNMVRSFSTVYHDAASNLQSGCTMLLHCHGRIGFDGFFSAPR